jgi:hypothetical protein
VSLFFERFACPPFEALTANDLSMQTLDSAARNLDRAQDSPITNSILHFFIAK